MLRLLRYMQEGAHSIHSEPNKFLPKIIILVSVLVPCRRHYQLMPLQISLRLLILVINRLLLAHLTKLPDQQGVIYL